MEIVPKIEDSWKKVLSEEFQKEYFAQLKAFLLEEKKTQLIYPSGSKIFEAFRRTPFEKLKVVILGQDPYHGEGQAEGLCFSVPYGIKPPPSLQNIFKELIRSVHIPPPSHGHLGKWADQGVFLLNTILTVRAAQAGSHQGKGWEKFTDQVIRILSEQKEGVIFLLWGSYAQTKASLIDPKKHYILKTVHPSPLSAHRGFIGCDHFIECNKILKQRGDTPIDWKLNENEYI